MFQIVFEGTSVNNFAVIGFVSKHAFTIFLTVFPITFVCVAIHPVLIAFAILYPNEIWRFRWFFTFLFFQFLGFCQFFLNTSRFIYIFFFLYDSLHKSKIDTALNFHFISGSEIFGFSLFCWLIIIFLLRFLASGWAKNTLKIVRNTFWVNKLRIIDNKAAGLLRIYKAIFYLNWWNLVGAIIFGLDGSLRCGFTITQISWSGRRFNSGSLIWVHGSQLHSSSNFCFGGCAVGAACKVKTHYNNYNNLFIEIHF